MLAAAQNSLLFNFIKCQLIFQQNPEEKHLKKTYFLISLLFWDVHNIHVQLQLLMTWEEYYIVLHNKKESKWNVNDIKLK